MKHKDEILEAHMGGAVGKTLGANQAKDPIGFDHRLYCKVRTEVEEKKQLHFSELAATLESSRGSPDAEEATRVQKERDTQSKEEETAAGEEEESEYETEEESEYETDHSGGEDDKAAETNPSEDILADLTPCDVRVLVHSEEELTQCETFERIFPTSDTGHYLEYMETNYYDLLLLAWERCHGGNRQTGRDKLSALTSKVLKRYFSSV